MADELDPQLMATGCLPQPPSTRVGAAYTGVRTPRDRWVSTDTMRAFVPRGKCQSTVPACNWYTTGKGYQTKYAMMTGKPYPEVSYCAGYAEDTNNNFNVGTMPADSIRAIAAKGCLPVVPGLPEWFNSPRRVPPEAVAGRKNLRADEWEMCQTGEDVVSAILNGDPVNIGIDWFDSDANPGPTGHLPVRGQCFQPRCPGGHSVLACGVVMGYALSPSGVGILFNNHHGDSLTRAQQDERGRTLTFPVWGDDGFGVMPLERIANGIPRYGSWALRSVFIPADALADVPDPQFPAAA